MSDKLDDYPAGFGYGWFFGFDRPNQRNIRRTRYDCDELQHSDKCYRTFWHIRPDRDNHIRLHWKTLDEVRKLGNRGEITFCSFFFLENGMINLEILSSLNKTVIASSLDNLSVNSSFYSNEIRSIDYNNYIIKISTNLNTVTFDNLFSGFNSETGLVKRP